MHFVSTLPIKMKVEKKKSTPCITPAPKPLLVSPGVESPHFKLVFQATFFTPYKIQFILVFFLAATFFFFPQDSPSLLISKLPLQHFSHSKITCHVYNLSTPKHTDRNKKDYAVVIRSPNSNTHQWTKVDLI